jgi:two-component system, OmpR family, response regulator
MTHRVLLVDDDPVILRLLEVNFRLEGFATDLAAHGDEALEKAASTPPDAVVLDVMMPGVDGYEVARRLRARDGLSSLPILFLTARTQDDDSLGDTLNDVDRLAKPFDPAEVVSRVRDSLSRGGP